MKRDNSVTNHKGTGHLRLWKSELGGENTKEAEIMLHIGNDRVYRFCRFAAGMAAIYGF